MKIISGTFKGQNIELTHAQTNNEQMRPTTNYTKNVLFNLLAQNKIVQTEIQGYKVLDCFCGTGSIGFEFASRGASFVTFVDSNETNISQIHKNAEKFQIKYSARIGFFPRCKIKDQFDIIFVDPPYIAAQSQILQTIKNLVEFSLTQNGTIILELPNTKKTNIKENISKIIPIVLEWEVSDKTILLFLKKDFSQISPIQSEDFS
jgi:16S rRNA (guanine(966)-N(2))-methyltransferase RsmD